MTTKAVIIGKSIFSVFDTFLRGFIFIILSFFVVRSLDMGGCMNGTIPMYVYAATAVIPSMCGARRVVVNMVVGPSAPPIIPMLAASPGVNPRAMAPRNAMYIPICAAIPSIMSFGFAMSGPKSVIAPSPTNIRVGSTTYIIPY